MKVKKSILIAFISCLFINNVTLSFAGTLSEDGRYETFKESNITINDILEEDTVDVEVEGRTLVNLWKGHSFASPSGWLQGEIQYKHIKNYLTVFNFSSKDILFQ